MAPPARGAGKEGEATLRGSGPDSNRLTQTRCVGVAGTGVRGAAGRSGARAGDAGTGVRGAAGRVLGCVHLTVVGLELAGFASGSARASSSDSVIFGIWGLVTTPASWAGIPGRRGPQPPNPHHTHNAPAEP